MAFPKKAKKSTNNAAEFKPGAPGDRVEIPALDVCYLKITLAGVSPLITNPLTEKVHRSLRAQWDGSPKKKKGQRYPVEEFKAATYFAQGGGYCFPSRGIKAAACTAAIDLDDASKAATRRAIHVLGEYSRVISDEPTMREDGVRLAGPSRALDLRYRPEHTEWEAEVIVQLKHKQITVPQLLHFFNEAGCGVGVGEDRPEKGGNHGQFEVAAAEYITKDAAYELSRAVVWEQYVPQEPEAMPEPAKKSKGNGKLRGAEAEGVMEAASAV